MNQPAEPLVRFTGVQKTYNGEQLVVRALDLDILRGEFLSLLGPSGSGQDHHADDAGRVRIAHGGRHPA